MNFSIYLIDITLDKGHVPLQGTLALNWSNTKNTDKIVAPN